MEVANNSSQEAALFCRYILSSLDHLLQCLEGLNEEQLNWSPPASNTNSLYALVVHTLGNVEENIIYILQGQVSQREREQEFLAKGSSTHELIIHWQDLRQRLEHALLNLSSEDLDHEFMHPRRGVVSGREILIVVVRHAAEHLGQAELTRDLLLATVKK